MSTANGLLEVMLDVFEAPVLGMLKQLAQHPYRDCLDWL